MCCVGAFSRRVGKPLAPRLLVLPCIAFHSQVLASTCLVLRARARAFNLPDAKTWQLVRRHRVSEEVSACVVVWLRVGFGLVASTILQRGLSHSGR